MEHSYKLKLPNPARPLEEDLENVPRVHGNDLDVLTQAMNYYLAEHYAESIVLSNRVMQSVTDTASVPDSVSKWTARSAFLDAFVRAKPLYEQSALDIEGIVEGSQTMRTYSELFKKLSEEADW